MVDKLFTLQQHRVKQVVGQMDPETMKRVDKGLRILLGLNPIEQADFQSIPEIP
jgi:hypothetical protein